MDGDAIAEPQTEGLEADLPSLKIACSLCSHKPQDWRSQRRWEQLIEAVALCGVGEENRR
jgi:hypothetical protein